MEATLAGAGILFRPMEVVDRNRFADRIAARFPETGPSSEDVGCTEDESVEDSIADFRRERHGREAGTLSSTVTTADALPERKGRQT